MKKILLNLIIVVNVTWVILLVDPGFSIRLKVFSSGIVLLTVFMSYLGLLKRNDDDTQLWKQTLLGAGPLGAVLYIAHKMMNVNLVETFVFKHVIQNHRVLFPVMIISFILSQFFVVLKIQYMVTTAIVILLMSFFVWLAIVFEHRLCSDGRKESVSFPTGGYFPMSAVGAFKYYKNVVLYHNKNFFRRFVSVKSNKNKHLDLRKVIFQTELLFVLGLFVPFLVFVEHLEIAKNVKVPGFMLWIALVIIKLFFYREKKLTKWFLIIALNSIWIFLVDASVGRL